MNIVEYNLQCSTHLRAFQSVSPTPRSRSRLIISIPRPSFLGFAECSPRKNLQRQIGEADRRKRLVEFSSSVKLKPSAVRRDASDSLSLCPKINENIPRTKFRGDNKKYIMIPPRTRNQCEQLPNLAILHYVLTICKIY